MNASTLSRKQREILEREELILDTASELLQSLGYLGLSMDRIAEAIEYSKGTIYQHFSCKEEVLCALCLRILNIQVEMLTRATHFQGCGREKILAVLMAHQLFAKIYKREFNNSLVIKSASIREKLSPESQKKLQDTEQQCLKKVSQIVREAINCGDLVLKDLSPEDLIFGLWSTSFGAAQLQLSDIPLIKLGISDPLKIIVQHSIRVLDSYGWKPMSNEWNYEKTMTRIMKELFHREADQLKQTRVHKF